MTEITKKIVWTIIVFTLIGIFTRLNLNETKSSESLVHCHELNTTFSTTECIAEYFRHPIVICGIVLFTLLIILQKCLVEECETDNNRNRNILWFVWYAPREFLYRTYRNLRHIGINCLNQRDTHTEEYAETAL